MPYKDPDKQRAYVKNSRERFNGPPPLEARQYYVVLRGYGLEITLYPQPEDTKVFGPGNLCAAIDAFVTAGGLEYDFGD